VGHPDLVQYGDTMTSPQGLVIPKRKDLNLIWRRDVLNRAKTSNIARSAIRSASANDLLYWINLAVWTFHQKQVDEQAREVSVVGEATHQPFITWKCQDECLADIDRGIATGTDVLIRKSRDMGASWLVVIKFMHSWLFVPRSGFLMLSRKEALVDRRGDPDSLFEKCRYILKWLPEWMRPRGMRDLKCHLENLDNGCTIEGESTNESAGQASRRTATLLDEFARIPNGAEIDRSTADTTACRIFNSTPQGPNTAFRHIRRDMDSGRRRGIVSVLPWWRHPDKGRGATLTAGDGSTPRWTNPWYELQCRRRSKTDIARNLDMDDDGAGGQFFDPGTIELLRSKHCVEPLEVGNLVVEDMNEEQRQRGIRERRHSLVRLVGNPGHGAWRFWFRPGSYTDRAGTVQPGPRPPQDTYYIFGCDISAGSGSSASVLSVRDHFSGRIVAKWWDVFTSPEDFAVHAAWASIWFGGLRPAIIVPEVNGPGVIFCRKLVGLGCPGLYYQTVEDERTRRVTKKWGWHSSRETKELLLGQYRDALTTGRLVNPCDEGMQEALYYSYDSKGRLDPGETEEGEASALHGDHVIADALTLIGGTNLPKNREADASRMDPKTFAGRRKAYEQKKRERENE
jgi:hypothetical protein